MFSTSSHRRRWLYESRTELTQLRREANESGRLAFEERRQLQPDKSEIVEPLSADEEELIVKQYAQILLQFCDKFTPKMPPSTVAIGMAYLQRFYLNHSVMEFYPREIMLTALYLAAKVDEFVVSKEEFSKNIPRKSDYYARIVVNSELFLIDALKYDLVVHTPYRPLEGQLLDLSATGVAAGVDMQKVHNTAHSFLEKSLLSDAGLLYPPSQIALGAVRYALQEVNSDIFEQFCAATLRRGVSSGQDEDSRLAALLQRAEDVCKLVEEAEERHLEPKDQDKFAAVETRLSQCRNPAHDPASKEFKEAEARVQEQFGRLLDREAAAGDSPGRPADRTALNLIAIRSQPVDHDLPFMSSPQFNS